MSGTGNANFKHVRELLISNGYELARTRGSHFIYTNGERTVSINRDLNKMVARRLIRENNLENGQHTAPGSEE